MFTTLFALHAGTLLAVLAFARWNTVRLDDAGRAVSADWQHSVVPASADAARV